MSNHIVAASTNQKSLHPCYTGFFDRFNRREFFEAHEVLEELWLGVRSSNDGDFYKGLIQVAGAFVHVQKRRRGPALALLSLARLNLAKYPSVHEQFDVGGALRHISTWEGMIRDHPNGVPELDTLSPILSLT